MFKILSINFSKVTSILLVCLFVFCFVFCFAISVVVTDALH